MSDLRMTIKPKSDQLNADDLISGPLTIKITKVSILAGEQPVALNFDGDGGKPYKPGKSMRRVLVKLWGPDGNAYVGRSMTLYRDDKVRFGGQEVGGIRISHMSHINKPETMALTETKASRKPFTVHPLKVEADKVAAGVDALIARIRAAETAEALDAIVADPAVTKQRDWIAEHRTDLAERLDAVLVEVDAALGKKEAA